LRQSKFFSFSWPLAALLRDIKSSTSESGTSHTVAKLMVNTLHQAGVRRIDGVVGDSLNGFTDELRTCPDMQWMHMRHKQAATFSALMPVVAIAARIPRGKIDNGYLQVTHLRFCFKNAVTTWSGSPTPHCCRVSSRERFAKQLPGS